MLTVFFVFFVALLLLLVVVVIVVNLVAESPINLSCLLFYLVSFVRLFVCLHILRCFRCLK